MIASLNRKRLKTPNDGSKPEFHLKWIRELVTGNADSTAHPAVSRFRPPSFSYDADLESLIPRVGALSEWPTSMIGLCQEKTRFSRRALRRSAQILSLQNSQPRSVPSRRGLLPFAEPDIHLLSPATCGDLHRRLSLCSLPVSKQSGGSLGSLRSVAQSATCKTWQAAY